MSFLPGSPPPPLAASGTRGTSQLPLFVENGFDQKPPIKSSSIRSSMHFQKGYINQHNTGVQISFNEYYSRKTTPSKQFLVAFECRTVYSRSSLWFLYNNPVLVNVKSGVLMIYGWRFSSIQIVCICTVQKILWFFFKTHACALSAVQ